MNVLNNFNNDNNIVAGNELHEYKISDGLISYFTKLWDNKKFTEFHRMLFQLYESE